VGFFARWLYQQLMHASSLWLAGTAITDAAVRHTCFSPPQANLNQITVVLLILFYPLSRFQKSKILFKHLAFRAVSSILRA
jgi:hypothetical protein